MRLFNKIKIVDLALYLDNNLIIADTHMGYEEALNEQGILVPRFQFKELIARFERILKELKINEKNKLKSIIINGDIKHEFGTISETEWRHTIRLLDFFSNYSKKIILIRGNHDTILGPIAKKRNVEIVDYLVIGDIILIHGDRLLGELKINKSIIKKIKTIVIGHEHPAISIRERLRSELFKCFLIGRYNNKNLIVQPSFNLVTEGVDILKEKLLSPYLDDGIKNFDAYIIADKVYRFGKLKCQKSHSTDFNQW